MRTQDLLDSFRPLVAGSLVVTDFDGTLAPLTLDPEDSRPVPGAVDALCRLADRGAQVAVVTGRDADTVIRLGGLRDVPGIIVAGVYGLETWADGELTSPDTPESIVSLRERLPRALSDARAHAAVWIEDKRLSLVVHARRAPDPQAALADLLRPVSLLAEELGFELHPGSGVLELRLPGFDKGGAVAELIERRVPTGVLYLGDDVGDLPALQAMTGLRAAGTPAWGVAVESSGVAEVAEIADVRVPDAAAAVELLTALVH